jgi:DNA invertase Pin-like site-specific DNA recombinase
MTKYIGYTRVSTKMQGESGLGLEAQRKTMEDYVKRQGGELVEVYEEIISGAAKTKPVLRVALKRAKADGATILFAKVDRATRSLLQFAQMIDNPEKVPVAACDLGMDMSEPAGKAMASMLAVFAEFEREQIRARTRDAYAAKLARGDGRNMLIGEYSKAQKEEWLGKNRDAVVIAADELRDQYGKVTGKAMAEVFESMGITTPRGNDNWQAIQAIRVLDALGIERR